MMSLIVENSCRFVQNSNSIPKYKRRKMSAVRDFPPRCGSNAPRIDVRNSVESKSEINDIVTHEFLQSEAFEIEKGPDEAFINSSIWGATSTNISNSNVSSWNLNRKYPQRTKISAIRDFPLLCGRHAPLLTKAECIKARSSTESVLPQRHFSSPLEKSELKKKAVVSDLMSDECDGRAEIRKEVVGCDADKGGAEILDIYKGKGIAVPSQGSKSTRKHLIVAENSAKVIDHALKAARSSKGFVSDLDDKCSGTRCSSEHNIGNVSVHAPMAAPNCPWRLGNRYNLTSRCAFPKNRGLKHGSSSHSGVKKSKLKKLFDERRALKAKSKRNKASSGYVEAIPFRSSFPCAAAIEGDELDSWEQDEGCEDFYVGLSTREIDLPPVVPNNLKIQKDSNDHVAYNKVREALRLFRDVYEKLIEEEDATLRMGATRRNRVDFAAATILKEQGKHVNTSKIVGSVPGVDIGLEFHFRVELFIVGLHRPPQAGIDYMNHGGTAIAISIVASGGYADDTTSADVLDYCGSGGNPSKGDKKFEDQKLERGNLALKNCISAKNPVRVIRGHDHKISGVGEKVRTFKTYTYDGLYIVTKYWQERGSNGNLVYMFRLERIPGQPELVWNLSRR